MKASVVLITAGTGPVEVRRFVAQLAKHLTDRCAEEGALVGEVVFCGDEDAPASVEIHLLEAPASIMRLSGTHALVSRSFERAKRSRKRWYAGVQVSADESENSAMAHASSIERSDVVITAMRAGGPGGQHVNKTSSAVRVFHAASGVSVRVADERSQRDNVRVALLRLSRIVAERAASRVSQAKAGRRLFHYRVERGRPAFVYELGREGELRLCDAICSR